MKIATLLAACIAFTSTLVAAIPSRTAQARTPARAFTVGVVTDATGLAPGSMNQQAWSGAQEAAKKYGVRVRLLTSKSEADYVRNLTNFAVHGYDLVVAANPSMSRALYIVATRYWKARYAILEAVPTNDKGRRVGLANVTDLWFRPQESGFLAGVLAGLMERHKVGKAVHNVIGYLGGRRTLAVLNYVTGYVAGARAVDPGLQILPGFSRSFTNRSSASTIGKAQVAEGADILFAAAGASGTAYMSAAGAHHLYAIGTVTDNSSAGSYVIASAVERVNVAVRDSILLAKRHRLIGGDRSFGLQDGAVALAHPSRAVPSWLQSRLKRDAGLIAKGKIAVPGTIP